MFVCLLQLKQDTNFLRHSLVGVPLKLKDGVLPHRFEWESDDPGPGGDGGGVAPTLEQSHAGSGSYQYSATATELLSSTVSGTYKLFPHFDNFDVII